MESDPRYRAARLVLALRQAGVTDHRVVEALEKTPREPFVPRPFQDDAWENVELPIDCGQTMLRPVTIGLMLQALDCQRDHAVLEIGTGSGYVSAVLSQLARRVYTIDRYRTLVERAVATLAHVGLASRVECRLADGLLGWAEAAPFDRALILGEIAELPADIANQMAPGGIVVMPVARGEETLIVRLARGPDRKFTESVVGRARFTPLEPGVAREL